MKLFSCVAAGRTGQYFCGNDTGNMEEEVDKLGGLPENTSTDVSCYVPEHSDQIRVEFVILVTKAISKYSSTISRMAAFTTMLSGRTKQNEKARYFYE